MEVTPIAVAPGIALTHAGNIAIYKLETVTPKPIDQMIEHIIMSLGNCTDGLYRTIYDLSGVSILRLTTLRFYEIGSIGLTVEGNEQALHVLAQKPDMAVALGIVTQASYSSSLWTASAQNNPRYQRKFFSSVERAVQWLEKVQR